MTHGGGVQRPSTGRGAGRGSEFWHGVELWGPVGVRPYVLRETVVRIRKLARRMFRQPRGYGVGERAPFRLFILISIFLTILCMQVLERLYTSLRGSTWPHHVMFMLLYVGFGASMYLGWRLWVQRKERFRALVRSANGDICPVCRYPMRVAVGERCPECGTVMDMMRIAKWRLWWRGG